MKNRISAILLLLFIAFIRPDQGKSQENEFKKYREQQLDEFDQFRAEVTQEYDEFVKKEQQEFEAFRKEVLKQWDEFKESTKKDWVEYDEDLSARSNVDFEKGEAEIEVLIPKNLPNAEAAAKDKLAGKIEKTIISPGNSNDYPKIGTTEGEFVMERPILEGQVEDSKGRSVDATNVDKFARDLVNSPAVETKIVKSQDGQERLKMYVSFPLVPDHIRIRAERFLPTVKKYASQYRLDPRLVLAVIQTESYFNPKAKSHVPAYGLMQLVVVSGAREAYLFVFNQDTLLSPDYLYVPENNILLGCAYLSKLRFHYFKEVESDDVAYPCIVASYNTGMGNVSKAIVGTKNLDKAKKEIMKMDREDILNKLADSLPFQETKDYLMKVLERMKIYEKWK